MTTRERNTLHKWIYATRPHTLGASIAPMLILLGALVRSQEGLRTWGFPYLLALIVAVFAQISSNLANDYFDFVGGKDTDERIGFERLLSSGEATPHEMLIALVIALVVTIISGVLFSWIAGWWVIIVGCVVVLAALGYSAGPYPLSHHGLGDIAVVLFYGLVPVIVPYVALIGRPTLSVFLYALGIGIWEANILVCNNYRDYTEDLRSGKRTLVVRLGEQSGPWLYALNSFLAFVSLSIGFILYAPPQWQYGWIAFLSIAMGWLTFRVSRKRGSALNEMLKETNLFSVIIAIGILLLDLLAIF